jgi:hypothetical protein
MQSINEFYNIKFRKKEKIDITKYEKISKKDYSYVGWLKIFFQELPKEFFIKINESRTYILNIYKERNRDRGKIIAIILPCQVPAIANNPHLDDTDLQLLKVREFAKRANITVKKASYLWNKHRKVSHE